MALPLASLGITPRQAAGLVAARPEKRTLTEEEVLRHIGSLHPQLYTALELFAAFAALLRSPPNPARAAEQLSEWIGQGRASGIPELKAFATKLGQDQEAVVAALALPYSQGQTQGFITKLKLLKRQMYDTVGECLASSQQSNEARWMSCGTGYFDQPCHSSQQIERGGSQEVLEMRPRETDVA